MAYDHQTLNFHLALILLGVFIQIFRNKVRIRSIKHDPGKRWLIDMLQVAADLLLTGRLLDADEAVRLGLAARTADRAVEAALDVARYRTRLYVLRGLQGNVVYLSRPIAPLIEPKCGKSEGGLRGSTNENSCAHHVTWSQIKLWRPNSIFNLCTGTNSIAQINKEQRQSGIVILQECWDLAFFSRMTDPWLTFAYFQSGLRIRIRIESGFNRVSGSGFGIRIRIRIQEGKNDPQK